MADNIRDTTERAKDADAAEWAERERKRREAWLAGPSEAERLEWARHEARSRSRECDPLDASASLGPTDEEARQWAEREHKRREAWLKGPTEAERLAWADRERQRRQRREEYDRPYAAPGDDDDDFDDEDMRRLRRDIELARRGVLELVTHWPYYLRSRLRAAGRRWEEGAYMLPERRPRYRLYDD